jgi:peptidoglycan-associated lipoprotein
MQNYGFIKLGVAALLSISMVACKSTDEAAATEAAAPAPAAARAANANDAAAAAELARKNAALAKTKFYFEFDKSDLSQEDRDALVYHAADLKANPSKHIRLEGHADERGTREYNLALGERRAQSVERYLQVQGVAASQMETVSYGEERPADTGTTEQAYSLNRRVEMIK